MSMQKHVFRLSHLLFGIEVPNLSSSTFDHLENFAGKETYMPPALFYLPQIDAFAIGFFWMGGQQAHAFEIHL